MFKDRVLGKIFCAKGGEVTGDLGKLHKEFHDLYQSPNII